MKIIKELEGSFSSHVYLVEIKGIKYVFKRANINDIISEKRFMESLSQHGITALNHPNCPVEKSNELLMEYVEGSKTLVGNSDEKIYREWGKITRKMHNIKYNTCFKYNKKGEVEKLEWSDYMQFKIEKAFAKSKENKGYGFHRDELKKIRDYLSPLFNVRPKTFSLIHGDFHTGNVLIKKKELIFFDKNPESFSGDYLLDLAIAIIDMPNGTLMKTSDHQHANDKACLNSFIEGYEKNFLGEPNLYRYIMLIAFGRLYTPYSKNYKDIIYRLLKKK